MGIGFDEFGNYKTRRFQGESRVNGVVGTWMGNATNSHVTLRGAMHPTGLSGGGMRGLRYSGYPVLITQSTLYAGTGTHGHVLNQTGGTYSTLGSLGSTNSFDLRPGSLATTEGAANYRKAFITLLPHVDGGFRVTVKVQHGTSTTTVIDNYHYRTSFVYTENANGNNSTTSNDEGTGSGPYSTTHTLDAVIPASFKIGFGASTGGASQVHLIRDLSVSLPYFPELEPDVIKACSKYTPKINLKPFENDVVYNGSLTGTPTSGNTNSYIDYDSFRFEDENGNQLGTSTAYDQLGVGTWNYDPTIGQVSFTPLYGFVGNPTIHYSIKGLNTNGGPFGQDVYRSAPTPINLAIISCSGLVNPAQSSGKQ